MTPKTTREERLRMLREQERAAAFDRLEAADAEHRRVESDLQRLDRRLNALAGSPSQLPCGTIASAGALAAGSRRHELDRRLIERLEVERSAVVARLQDAQAAVELAREEVASATRALRALGL